MKKNILLIIPFILIISACCTQQKPLSLLEALEIHKKHPPMPEAVTYLVTDEYVTYEKKFVPEWNTAYHSFSPKALSPTAGLILYGGSQVDVRSYAPLAYQISHQGIFVALVTMPIDMALLAPERAGAVIKDYPDIEIWVIGGHSMGGIAACNYAVNNPESVNGVVLWGSEPTEKYRLDKLDIPVLSIYATKDGIRPWKAIENSLQYLPNNTTVFEIKGGNHFQFGWYEEDHKPYDKDATISREEQQNQIVKATVDFIKINYRE